MAQPTFLCLAFTVVLVALLIAAARAQGLHLLFATPLPAPPPPLPGMPPAPPRPLPTPAPAHPQHEHLQLRPGVRPQVDGWHQEGAYGPFAEEDEPAEDEEPSHPARPALSGAAFLEIDADIRRLLSERGGVTGAATSPGGWRRLGPEPLGPWDEDEEGPLVMTPEEEVDHRTALAPLQSIFADEPYEGGEGDSPTDPCDQRRQPQTDSPAPFIQEIPEMPEGHSLPRSPAPPTQVRIRRPAQPTVSGVLHVQP